LLCGKVFTYEGNLSKHFNKEHAEHVFEYVGGMVVLVPKSEEQFLNLSRLF